jgi:hypothetical protein
MYTTLVIAEGHTCKQCNERINQEDFFLPLSSSFEIVMTIGVICREGYLGNRRNGLRLFCCPGMSASSLVFCRHHLVNSILLQMLLQLDILYCIGFTTVKNS